MNLIGCWKLRRILFRQYILGQLPFLFNVRRLINDGIRGNISLFSLLERSTASLFWQLTYLWTLVNVRKIVALFHNN